MLEEGIYGLGARRLSARECRVRSKIKCRGVWRWQAWCKAYFSLSDACRDEVVSKSRASDDVTSTPMLHDVVWGPTL